MKPKVRQKPYHVLLIAEVAEVDIDGHGQLQARARWTDYARQRASESKAVARTSRGLLSAMATTFIHTGMLPDAA